MEPLDLLQKYWNYNSFRPGQEQIIQEALQGNDVLALLPTGGGKSVCFQVPGLALPHMTLVISPLVALMTDQVNNLKSKGISAFALHAGLDGRQINRILDNVVEGAVKFLYISPERLATDRFRDRLSHMKVSLLVVDEAHCISQWGYDFRPPYQRISEIRNLIPHCPVMAVTATATDNVCKDIMKSLHFKKENVIRNSFARSNMHLIARQEDNKWGKLMQIMHKVQGSSLIYVRNRKGTKQIASFLQRNGISAAHYHAGLSSEERQETLQNWLNGNIRVVACTNAFGMGIDKADVRLVIHWDLPDSIEAYFQEAGRAGRDGKTCYAGIIYGPHDIQSLQDNFKSQFPPAEDIRITYQALANFYQLASGAGQFETFPFDFDKVHLYSRQSLLSFNYGLRILQQQGFIYLNENARSVSVIKVLTDHENLYRYQIENRKAEPVIKAFLRLCPGVFEEYAPVKESEIAHLTKLSKQQVESELLKLSQLEVIEYQPVNGSPAITWLTPRYPASELPLNNKLLRSIKEEAEGRMQAMKQYVLGKPGCRMMKILTYFGEKSTPCGKCDYCMEAASLELTNQDIALAFEWLEDCLKQRPMNLNELQEFKPPLKRKKLMEAIQFLLDNRRISYNQFQELTWIG